jgi:hypothetical protein
MGMSQSVVEINTDQARVGGQVGQVTGGGKTRATRIQRGFLSGLDSLILIFFARVTRGWWIGGDNVFTSWGWVRVRREVRYVVIREPKNGWPGLQYLSVDNSRKGDIVWSEKCGNVAIVNGVEDEVHGDAGPEIMGELTHSGKKMLRWSQGVSFGKHIICCIAVWDSDGYGRVTQVL